MFIVCLWKLERDRDDFNDKHGGDDDPMPGDVFGTLYYEKVVFIQNLRVRINYAIDVILDPVNAAPNYVDAVGPDGALVERQGELTEFEQELYNYETESDFDSGSDSRSDGLDVD